MNILLDFLPLQLNGGIGGAASFTMRVCEEVFSKKTASDTLYGVWDSTIGEGALYKIERIAKIHHILLLDLAKETLEAIVSKNKINTFFIAIGQFYINYRLEGITCKTIMFIHDISEIERCDNKADVMLYDQRIEPKWEHIKRLINLFSGRWKRQANAIYNHIMPLYAAPNTIPYTVSTYSKYALEYYFPQLQGNVRVCYSPTKRPQILSTIENRTLYTLISQNKKFFLMLAANRRYKNAKNVLNVIYKILDKYPDFHIITLKYGTTRHKRHIDIPILSDSDLEHAYKHAYALIFASFFEGFGYPPIEAMKYGTPTVASNVTSIPEIYGNSGICFSPFYPADLYRAILAVINNRNQYCTELTHQYELLLQRQAKDLDLLIKEIYKS